MTGTPGHLRHHRPTVLYIPKLTTARLVLGFAFLTTCVLWPYFGLTIWHLTFFVILIAFLLYSYTNYIISFILYFTMMLIYWIITPVFQSAINVGYYTWRYQIPDFSAMAFVFTSVNLLGLFIGYNLKTIKVKPHKNFCRNFSFTGILLIMMILIGLIAIIGYETILLPRSEQAMEMTTYALFFENVTKLLPAFLIAYFILESDKLSQRNTQVFTLFILLLLALIVSNPINTGRFISLYGALIVFVTYSIKYSKLRLLAWLLMLSPFYAFFVLGITSMARGGIGNIDIERVFDSLRTLEFSSYSIFLDALKIDSFYPDNYLLSHLFIFVPRSIWVEKADSIGIFVASNSGYVYPNVGLISFFNAYADFGFMAVFLMSLCFGFLVKNLNPIKEVASFRNRRFVYGVSLASLTPMIFRGDLSTAMIALYSTVWAYEMTRLCTRFVLRPRVA